MITFQNVSKYYDYQAVLKGINFSIDRGEMAFLTGPSGAGKSTLLKLIYLLEWPDEGDVTIGDFHIPELRPSKIPDVRRIIGVVFQDFKLINNLSVYDNIALTLRIRGWKERDIKSKVSDALKKVNLRHLSDSFPERLSGGEQQRIAIARAIVGEPLVILADEPTGNLDPNTALDIIKLFKDINIQGTTVLIATHNKELFKHSGRRVLKLDGGNFVGEEVG